jgi:SAM-dependent methyltransferase
VITQLIPTDLAVCSAFGEFAAVYDAYTAHPDYEGWIRGLVRLAERHGAFGPALDLGCGTGSSTAPLLDIGYAVTAVDCVPEMLARARAKTPGAHLELCDVTALPALGRFGLVLCANDVVNYLLTPEDLRAALAGAAANLAPGGVLVFDANTLATFRETFATSHVRTQGELEFTWHGLAPAGFAAGGVARADLAHGALTSVHLQRHHPHEEITAALRDAGLELRAVLGQLADGRREDLVDETRHPKAVYVARRPTTQRG